MDYEMLSRELCQLHIKYASALNSLTHLMEVRGEDGLLIWLSQKTDHVTASEIAQHFALTSGRVANILRTLEKKGLLVRKKDTQDLRKVLVEITAEGKAYATQEYLQMIERHRLLLETLGQEDALSLLHLFERIATVSQQEELHLSM